MQKSYSKAGTGILVLQSSNSEAIVLKYLDGVCACACMCMCVCVCVYKGWTAADVHTDLEFWCWNLA